MGKIKVLVTGVGGPLGVNILKCIRLSKIKCEIVGTDINEFSAGCYLADKAYTLPDARREEPRVYLERMIDICRREDIRAVFTGSNAELSLLAANKEQIEKETKAVLIVNNREVVETACDKWKTVKFLQEHDIPVPHSILPGNRGEINHIINKYGFPLIVKPRTLSGSVGVFTVKNKDELRAALVLNKDAVIQEYLCPADQEYTVGVFREKDGRYVGSFIFHRWLESGLTYKATVSKNNEVENVSRKAAEALGAIGPINVQLRLTQNGPVIFEINPRMSCSAVMRAHFGFNEAEMAIRHFVLEEKLDPPRITEGAALRYWEEIYV